jgi:hypothetical protein
MAQTHPFTQRQMRRVQQLPHGHEFVGTRQGMPLLRRADGRLLRVQPDGRLAEARLIKSVRHYLEVRG